MNVVTENQSYFEFKRTEEVEEWARKYYADLLDSPREDELHKLILHRCESKLKRLKEEFQKL